MSDPQPLSSSGPVRFSSLRPAPRKSIAMMIVGKGMLHTDATRQKEDEKRIVCFRESMGL